MKQTTSDISRALRQLTALLLVLIGCYNVAVADIAYSDDINTAILVEGSIPVYWTNDQENPWIVDENTVYNVAPYQTDGVSALSFTYSSSYPVEITFEILRNYYSWNSNDTEGVYFYIDDEYQYTYKDSYFTTKTSYLPEGRHTIRFENHSGTNPIDVANYRRAVLRNIRVWECKELHTGCLTTDSAPLSFENDPINPWIADEGFIRSNSNGNSIVTTSFSLDRPANFSCNLQYDYGDGSLSLYVDDKEMGSVNNDNRTLSPTFPMEPGVHTVSFIRHATDGNIDGAKISKVELYTKWIDVTIPMAGLLGLQIMYNVQDLKEVKLLSIEGEMNSEDWNTINNLDNLRYCDISKANITSIPDYAFIGKGGVILPEGLKIIGEGAFYASYIRTITIPSSVESFGESIFEKSDLESIIFKDNSELSYLPAFTFWDCEKLTEVILPNSVKEIRTDDRGNGFHFSGCTNLQKLYLPDEITSLPYSFAKNCPNISDLHLPNKLSFIGQEAFAYSLKGSLVLPENLSTIFYEAFHYSGIDEVIFPKHLDTLAGSAFYNCKNLKKIVFSSYMPTLEDTFSGCTSVQTIICPCATPPIIGVEYEFGEERLLQPFYGANVANIKLFVPDFAMLSYKLHDYWRNFQIETNDEVSISDSWSIFGSLNLFNENRIPNTPDLELCKGSSLAIFGDAPQSFNNFLFLTEESSPARYLSLCDQVTTSSLEARFYTPEANKWYFFSPIADINVADVKHESTESFVIRAYNGEHRATSNTTSGNWTTLNDGLLKRGQGYVMQADKTGWVSFPVPVENNGQFLGNEEVALNLIAYECDNIANANWNFIGNPYPSYFDIYYMDLEAPITIWDGSTYKALSLRDDNYALRPMQSFFVQKPEIGANALMLLGGRQLTKKIEHGNGSGKAPVREPSLAQRNLIDIEIILEGDSAASDMTRVVLNEGSSLNYETTCDASKFMSMDSSIAQIYSIDNSGNALAINERPYANGNASLGIYTTVRGGTYRIESPRADCPVYLYDAKLGLEHNLLSGAYIFEADSEGHNISRFSLRFEPGTTVISSISDESIRVVSGRNAIYVSAPTGANINVYSVNGSLEASSISQGATLNFVLDKGVYVVTIDGESFKKVVK